MKGVGVRLLAILIGFIVGVGAAAHADGKQRSQPRPRPSSDLWQSPCWGGEDLALPEIRRTVRLPVPHALWMMRLASATANAGGGIYACVTLSFDIRDGAVLPRSIEGVDEWPEGAGEALAGLSRRALMEEPWASRGSQTQRLRDGPYVIVHNYGVVP